MAKQTGLGMNCYVGGYNISNDVGSIKNISCPQTPHELTGIDKFAYERAGGLRAGKVEFTSWLNTAASQEHVALSGLPTTDVVFTVTTATSIGSAAASMIGKQINYDMTRGNDGELSIEVSAESNGYGIDWGSLLTAGIRTDVSGTNGTSFDFGAATSFGWQAYLHVTALTGTNVVVTLEDSANNSAFATFTGSAFTSATAVGAQRLAAATSTATVRQYVRAVSSGTFTSASFSVVFVKNPTVAVVF